MANFVTITWRALVRSRLWYHLLSEKWLSDLFGDKK